MAAYRRLDLVVADVPADTAVVGIPAKPVVPRDRAETRKFMPYGTPCGEIPDPVARALTGLLDQVTALQARVGELEADRPSAALPRSTPTPLETVASHNGGMHEAQGESR